MSSCVCVCVTNWRRTRLFVSFAYVYCAAPIGILYVHNFVFIRRPSVVCRRDDEACVCVCERARAIKDPVRYVHVSYKDASKSAVSTRIHQPNACQTRQCSLGKQLRSFGVNDVLQCVRRYIS